jgi:hypothetical protein
MGNQTHYSTIPVFQGNVSSEFHPGGEASVLYDLFLIFSQNPRCRFLRLADELEGNRIFAESFLIW